MDFISAAFRWFLGPTPRQGEITYSDLPKSEQKVQQLVREVYGDAIQQETFVREGEDEFAQLELDESKANISKLKIDLSSLARKQRDDGLTDAALRASLRF